MLEILENVGDVLCLQGDVQSDDSQHRQFKLSSRSKTNREGKNHAIRSDEKGIKKGAPPFPV